MMILIGKNIISHRHIVDDNCLIKPKIALVVELEHFEKGRRLTAK